MAQINYHEIIINHEFYHLIRHHESRWAKEPGMGMFSGKPNILYEAILNLFDNLEDAYDFDVRQTRR